MDCARFTFKNDQDILEEAPKNTRHRDVGGAKIHRHAVDQASAPKGCFPPARPDDMQILVGFIV
jgi:hypothetical protein